MANVALMRQVDHTIGLTDDDKKLLEGFVTSLPGGWRHEFDGEICSRLYIWRTDFAASASPLVHVDRTSETYLVTIYDPVVPMGSSYLNRTEQEVFQCETVADAIVELQGLVCELMQTQDYSLLTPSSWSSCRDCDSCTLSAANCTKWNPSVRLRAA